MQQTEFTIETGGAKIKTLDTDGNGNFIALTETGEVIAHDFRTTLKRVRRRAPLEFRHPLIRRLDAGRFLVADRYSKGDHNGRVFNLNAEEIDSFHLGNAIDDILVFSDKLVVMYDEEGIYTPKTLASSGIAILSFDGEKCWGFNDLIESGKLTEEALICDLQPICKYGANSILFFSHFETPQLTELNLDNYALHFTPVPERVRYAEAISTTGDGDVFFHRPGSVQYPEPDKGKFFWWDRQSEDVDELPEKVLNYLKGLENGKFLLERETGYTIIDPLAFAIKHSVAVGSRRLELVLDDITNQEVDVIVNAANSQLAGGFGVDGAIHRRGGPAIMEETRAKYYLGCPTGSAVPSNAGKLNAKYVFHAIGPRWFEDPERFDLLRSAYRRCLELAVELDCRSIAFPSISTGDFGFPLKESSVVAIETVCEFLRCLSDDSPLKFVRFCLFSEKDLEIYREAVESCRDERESVE